MNILKRLISICIVVLISTSCISQNIIGANGVDDLYNTDSGLHEVKTYHTATINDDFADNKLIVVFSKEESIKLKDHKPEDFTEISVKKITDLTPSTKDYFKNRSSTDSSECVGENRYANEKLDIKGYNQIISIELKTSGKENVLKAIKAIENRNDVLYVGPDYRISIDSKYSDDSYCSLQWSHDVIDLPEAWDITTGSDSVIVGIMDTGIDGTHEDLTDSVNQALSRDFTNGTIQQVACSTDPNGHGTHVAGIIGACGTNGIGVSGICWDVQLVSLRVLDAGGFGYSSNVITAIDYATVQNIPILNLSGGWYLEDDKYDIPMKTAIAYYPGLFINSAGNKSENIDQVVHYPSEYNLVNMITVANTTSADELNASANLKGSNYGVNTVHLAAPGTLIYNCVPIDKDVYDVYDGYTYKDGTSMAAPHVSGVAALILSIRPDLTPTEVKKLILDNVDSVEALSGKCVTGGRLNAYKAVRAATESQTFNGDVNGDGRSDVILSRNVNGKRALTTYLGRTDGSFAEPITTQFTNSFVYSDPAFVGDFNGDGLTDVVIHWCTSSGNRRLLVYISKGDGTFKTGVNLNSTRYHNSNEYPCSFHIADVNGDGKDDFVVHYRNTNGYRYALVYKGTSASPYFIDATTNALQTTNIYGFNEPVYTGDFNGDGYDDMVVHGGLFAKRQLRVYVGKSNGTFETGDVLNSTRTYDPALYPSIDLIADVNGDGKDDFVVHWKNGAGKRNTLVYLGKATAPYLTDATTNALTSNNNYIETDPVFVGDVNGDGRDDITVHWTSPEGKRQLLTYTANANGTYNSGINYSAVNTSNPSQYADTYMLADVNGDGRADLIDKWKSGTDTVRLYTYKGTAQGSFSAATVSYHSTEIPYYPNNSSNVYVITNVGAGKCLNVYGDNVTSLYNNQNVCLWTSSGTNEQKWYIPSIGNGVYIKSVINTAYGLNVYRTGDPWNCDLYVVLGNETDAKVDFIATNGGYKIKLSNYDLYLTAASSADGANVYWSASSTSTYQIWSLTAE